MDLTTVDRHTIATLTVADGDSVTERIQTSRLVREPSAAVVTFWPPAALEATTAKVLVRGARNATEASRAVTDAAGDRVGAVLTAGVAVELEVEDILRWPWIEFEFATAADVAVAQATGFDCDLIAAGI